MVFYIIGYYVCNTLIYFKYRYLSSNLVKEVATRQIFPDFLPFHIATTYPNTTQCRYQSSVSAHICALQRVII